MLILDEPTSNLDPAISEEIMKMLDELNCGGKTIVTTHDVGWPMLSRQGNSHGR